MCLFRNDKGFSFAELTITISLVALLLIPFFGLLHAALRYYRTTESSIEGQQNLRIAMEAITSELRRCQGLIGKAADVDLSEENLLLLTKEQDIIWYYLSAQDLRRAVKGKWDSQFYGHNPVAGGITSLTFSYNQMPFAHSNQITVIITGQDEAGRLYELSATVVIRVD
ncbi:MAG: hypothetical protein GX750_05240 [Clostridia bacterium]|nr:hypothetical protein [Clostridia bacterium]